MTYSQKIQASKEVLNAIKSLKADEVMQFVYGTEKDYKTGNHVPVVYEIKARDGFRGKMDYSVCRANAFFGQSMNVDKVTGTTIRLYSYDMMGTRTTYVMPLYEMKVGVITVNEDTNIY